MSIRSFLFTTLFILAMCLFSGCQTTRPQSFVEQPATWNSITIRKGLAKDAAWQKVADLLAKSYDLEVMNKDTGYIRTAYKLIRERYSSGPDGASYRKRVIAKIQSDTDVIEIRTEAAWWEFNCWVEGYDSTDLSTLKTDISAVIGDITK
ncbi:MAG: hypothetical protein AAB263_06070 [Planctomycetota bacterium]